jgi:predicted ATPase
MPNNLPIQITSLIGRELEIAEVQRLLATTRLLSLTGSGGTGKTRLALELAAAVLDSFRDGVWLVELAPLSDSTLVPVTIATVLGVQQEQGRPLTATLTDWLRDKQLLLVLDNCEHLIGACAQFADAMLRASRETRILATSREALGIAGELAYRVPSLATPAIQPSAIRSRPIAAGNPQATSSKQQAEMLSYAAVRLFVERASFALPAFALNDDNAPAIAQICYRLDGIPLAIELAAARVKVLSAEKIAERLDDRFRLLTGGSRTALPRQQTLRGAIDWSHSLLSQPERALLRRLAVFAGSWTLEAAEVVCAGDGLIAVEVLDLLTHLVDKSLVLADGQAAEPRYRMLETIRQYARERLLDAQESERLRDRHLKFFFDMVERAEPVLLSAQRAEWIPRLELEHDNLRAALEWACERDVEVARQLAANLRWFWSFGDHLGEALAWYTRVLGLSERATGSRGLAGALLGMGEIANHSVMFNEARAALEQSSDLWRKLGDNTMLAESLVHEAGTLRSFGQTAAALEIFRNHETVFRESAVPYVLAFTLSIWGGPWRSENMITRQQRLYTMKAWRSGLRQKTPCRWQSVFSIWVFGLWHRETMRPPVSTISKGCRGAGRAARAGLSRSSSGMWPMPRPCRVTTGRRCNRTMKLWPCHARWATSSMSRR